jgi:hypothetical protein
MSDPETFIIVKDFTRIFIGDALVSDCSSGGKGSAIYINNFNKVEITNIGMFANGPPAGPDIEAYLSTIWRRYSDTYANFPPDSLCYNDLDFLDRCVTLYPERPPLLYSRTQGAIYVDFCTSPICFSLSQSLLFTGGNIFTNEAGPLMDYLYPDYRYKTAATLFLGSGIRNVTFDDVKFLNHIASDS